MFSDLFSLIRDERENLLLLNRGFCINCQICFMFALECTKTTFIPQTSCNENTKQNLNAINTLLQFRHVKICNFVSNSIHATLLAKNRNRTQISIEHELSNVINKSFSSCINEQRREKNIKIRKKITQK